MIIAEGHSYSENFIGLIDAGRAISARGTDVHHVLDQTLDRLVVTQFSSEALPKRVNYASASVSPVRCSSARASRSDRVRDLNKQLKEFAVKVGSSH